VENVARLADAIMTAIGRRVGDAALVQQMKLDVLAMLPQSVRPAETAAALAPPPDANDPPAEMPVVALPKPAVAEPAAAVVNGVPDGDYFDEV
jgi:hypothetical protein